MMTRNRNLSAAATRVADLADRCIGNPERFAAKAKRSAAIAKAISACQKFARGEISADEYAAAKAASDAAHAEYMAFLKSRD